MKKKYEPSRVAVFVPDTTDFDIRGAHVVEQAMDEKLENGASQVWAWPIASIALFRIDGENLSPAWSTDYLKK